MLQFNQCGFIIITEVNLMEIKRAKESDIEQITKLLYQVHKIHSDKRPDLFIPEKKKYNENELKSIIKNEEKPIFIATDEKSGNILGYAFCIFQKQNADSMQPIKTLYIDDLCVDENLRGGGIGYKIFEYVKNYAKEKHCYNLTLNVWALNESAKKFYEKCGLKIQKYTMENIL